LADLGEGTALLILSKMKSQEEEKQEGKAKKKTWSGSTIYLYHGGTTAECRNDVG